MFFKLKYRKKKVKFIIPPNHALGSVGQIEVKAELINVEKNTNPKQQEETVPESKPNQNLHEIKAFTISSLAKEKDLIKNTQFQTQAKAQYEVRPFTENEMLLQWNKYAQKMEEQGNLILNSILTMSDPKLNEDFSINYTLPNESTKFELEKNKTNLLGYLRGMLHNHDIQLNVSVVENVSIKRFYTPEEKYNHFKTLNPDIEILRQTFGLDF